MNNPGQLDDDRSVQKRAGAVFIASANMREPGFR
jgi:hypothetical protein